MFQFVELFLPQKGKMVSLRIILIIQSFIRIFGINYLLQMHWLVIPDSPFLS
jgi:hypothetical protein